MCFYYKSETELSIKENLGMIFVKFRVFFSCGLCWLLLVSSAAGEVNVWQDPMTGYALGGYDPVAYYTRGEATPGSSDHQYYFNGVTWKFENIGNKDAFIKTPYVYHPDFAGYDPYALLKGRTAQGVPTLWVKYKRRLFLFHNIVNKHLWTQEKEKHLEEADKIWPKLSKTLLSPIK